MSKNFYIYHNLDSDNLDFIFKQLNGSIPCPSMAIAHEFEKFGDISLVFDPGSLSPRAADIYLADSYSMRMPRVEYKLDYEQIAKIQNEISQLVMSNYGFTERECVRNYFFKDEYNDNSHFKSGKFSSSSILTDNLLLRLAFLNECGIKQRVERRWAEYPLTFASKKSVNALSEMLDPVYDRNNQLLFRSGLHKDLESYLKKLSIDSTVSEYDRGVVLKSNGFDSDGNLSFNKWTKVRDFYEKNLHREKALDSVQLAKSLDRKIALRDKARCKYYDWLNKVFSGCLFRPYFHLNGRKKDLNVDNLVKAMRNKSLAKENSIIVTPGHLRSFGLKKVKRMSDIKKSLGLVVSDEVMQVKQKEMNQMVSDFIFDINNKYKFDQNHFGYMETALKEMMEYSRRGRDKAYISESFNFDEQDFKRLDAIIDKLSCMESHYFEVKFNRAVGISEFTHAIVPRGTKKELVKQLRECGLRVLAYNDQEPSSRYRAVTKTKNELFVTDLESSAVIDRNVCDLSLG